MIKKDYLAVIEFLQESFEGDIKVTREKNELVTLYQEIEKIVFQKYVNKKHRVTSFEKPLTNSYNFITKNCSLCKKLNAQIFNNDLIDDQTMLLDFEKEEIQQLFDDNFTYLHCLLCDDHVPMDLVKPTRTFTCDKCYYKLNE